MEKIYTGNGFVIETNNDDELFIYREGCCLYDVLRIGHHDGTPEGITVSSLFGLYWTQQPNTIAFRH